jgi:hypothetical protein
MRDVTRRAAANTAGHVTEHVLIAPVVDVPGLGDTHVDEGRFHRVLSDDALHRLANAEPVRREVRARARLGKRDEGHRVERGEPVEKLHRRIHDRLHARRGDVELIDGNDDLTAVGGSDVARVVRLCGIGGPLPGLFEIDLDQIRRHHAAGFAVDLHREVGRGQIFDRSSVPVDDTDIDRDQLDARLERRPLRRRLLRGHASGHGEGGGDDQRNEERSHARILHPRETPGVEKRAATSPSAR